MTRGFLYFGTILFAASPAFAQPAPPQGNIEERVRQQVRLPTENERKEALITGDTDVLLLRRTQLFNLTGSLDITGTSNAALSADNVRPDSFIQGQIGLGIGTRIGNKVDVFANTSIVGVRYFNEKALDYNAISAVVGARAGFGRFGVTATYQPSLVYNRDFSTRQLKTHRLRLGVSMGWDIRGVGIEPEIHGERAITHPGDYSAWNGGGSLTVSSPLSKTHPILAYARIGYDRRNFDNYFEDFVGTKRVDDNLSAGAGILWRPRNWGEVRASYNFDRNWSTSDVNRYEAHASTLGIAATVRF